jgi:IS4 transposase
LYAWSDGLPVAERFALDLPERPGKRSARTATLDLRYGAVVVKRPRNGSDPGAAPTLTLRMVDVREVGVPAGEDPVHWRLLTTHQVEDTAKALEIVLWYRRRWTIEQLFRTLKTQGLVRRRGWISSRARSKARKRFSGWLSSP